MQVKFVLKNTNHNAKSHESMRDLLGMKERFLIDLFENSAPENCAS